MTRARLRSRPWPRLLLAWALGSAAVAAAAAGGAPLSSAEAGRWFARMHAAAQQLNYEGTLVASGDGSLSSARVGHFCDAGSSFERVEVLDGRMQQIYRHNDWVTTLWPRSRVAVVEQREPRLASLRQVLEPRAEQSYEVREQGAGHVAGREATVLLLSPRDDHRFAQRLWVDTQTALVLRADVLGTRQQVLESSAFSHVDIGVKPKPRSVLLPMRQLDGYRQVRPVQAATRLEAEGWSLAPPVPGFQLAGCARRSLDPASDAAASPTVLQAVFSDGLTQVSLFVEALDGRRHRGPLQAQSGATHTLMQPLAGEWWVTAVGDVPAATLRQFVQSLERRR